MWPLGLYCTENTNTGFQEYLSCEHNLDWIKIIFQCNSFLGNQEIFHYVYKKPGFPIFSNYFFLNLNESDNIQVISLQKYILLLVSYILTITVGYIMAEILKHVGSI